MCASLCRCPHDRHPRRPAAALTEAEAALERLAQDATPGEWENRFSSIQVFRRDKIGRRTGASVEVVASCEGYPSIENRADAEFIAAANPQTVLGLLAVIRELRAQLAEAEAARAAVTGALAVYANRDNWSADAVAGDDGVDISFRLGQFNLFVRPDGDYGVEEDGWLVAAAALTAAGPTESGSE